MTNRLFDSSQAQHNGYVYLAGWLAEVEELWTQYGRGRRTLTEQLDYYGQLTAQLPPSPLRVVYAASGTLPAAALLPDSTAIVEHKLYWAPVSSEGEGRYLLSVLNSEAARRLAEHLQSRGQWGARDFDKVMLSLPVPRFEPSNTVHQELAKAAAHAEKVAAAVTLKEGAHFVRARQIIRAALCEDGIAQYIDELVPELLRAQA